MWTFFTPRKDPDPVPPSLQTLTLEHCLSLLRERQRHEGRDAWLWARRERVARYLLTKHRDAVREGRAPRHPRPGLTPEEMERIEATHPLLQPYVPGKRNRIHPFRHRLMHQKVEAYLERRDPSKRECPPT